MIAAAGPDPPAEKLVIHFEPTLGKACLGRCDPKNGPYIPASELGTHQLHFTGGNTDVYVIVRQLPAPDSASAGQSSPSHNKRTSGTVSPPPWLPGARVSSRGKVCPRRRWKR